MATQAQISRREFLAAANAAALLLLLESCSLGPLSRSIASPQIPSGATPYEQALKLLLDAVRLSPDHLAQRSADLVAAKDATRIVEFVRDRISALPPRAFDDDPNYAQWWGGAATLRSGQGTLRERAEILADMLSRAGFAAQVSSAKRPAAIGLKELYGVRIPQFAPDQSRIDLARSVLRQAGAPAPATPQAVRPAPDAAAAILGALPSSLQQGFARSDLLPDRVPVVVFTDRGKKRYAFALGNLGIDDTSPAGLSSLAGASAPTHMTITVSALANPAPGSSTPPGKLIDLVSGTWPADVLAGHQVLLTFTPPQGPQAVLDYALASLPVRIPFLRVQTDQPAPPGVSLIAAGPPVTMQGDVLQAPSNGPSPSPGADIEGPFGPIKTLTDADRKLAAARAVSIKASASAAAFPEIEVLLSPDDSSGASVDGLDAASLTVKENGTPVDGFTLYSNARVQQRPRVFIAYDANATFGFWPSDAARAAFETGLASALAAQAAKTPFDVQVLGLGQGPDPNGWVLPQADAVTAAMRATFESADDPWKTVGGAALDQGVTAIILISDNNSLDVDPRSVPMYQQRLVASGVPVFAVPVGQVDAAATTQIVTLSGGARLDQNDPATPGKLVSLIAPLVSSWISMGYRLRYTAHPDGPTQRTVTIGLASQSQPTGSATYQVPASPVPPPSFVGLYARIEMPGLNPAFRRLAGLEATAGGGVLGSLGDAGAAAETRAAMNGVTTVAIEPGATTTAALLDDLLTSALSIEPLRPLWGKSTSDQMLRAVPNGIRRVPAALVSMLRAAPPDPEALPGFRVAILQERAVASSNSVELHADFAIGANQVVPIATDRHAAFTAVVKTSVNSSGAEAATLGDSAYSRLAGKSLVPLASGDYGAANAFIASVPASSQQTWRDLLRVYNGYHVLAPTGGSADAFWVVDPASGTAKAVLLDGTGGARLSTKCKTDAVDDLALSLAMLSIMCSYGLPYPFFCTGINTASAAMSAALLFTPKADPGTPFSLGLGIVGPALGEGFGWFTGSVGIVLLMISMWAVC